MVLFSPNFKNSLFLILSLPVVLSLPVMQAHSHLHPYSHPGPPPHSCVVFCLSPAWLCAVATMLGPGDEVTLHRRSAGLSEPRPSPPLPTIARGLMGKPPTPAHTSTLLLRASSNHLTFKQGNNRSQMAANLEPCDVKHTHAHQHVHACVSKHTDTLCTNNFQLRR